MEVKIVCLQGTEQMFGVTCFKSRCYNNELKGSW